MDSNSGGLYFLIELPDPSFKEQPGKNDQQYKQKDCDDYVWYALVFYHGNEHPVIYYWECRFAFLYTLQKPVRTRTKPGQLIK